MVTQPSLIDICASSLGNARRHIAGVQSEIAERCLNHRLRGTEVVYNAHGYFDERRSALEALIPLLLDIDSGVKKAAHQPDQVARSAAIRLKSTIRCQDTFGEQLSLTAKLFRC